jgi:hypothetical protein
VEEVSSRALLHRSGIAIAALALLVAGAGLAATVRPATSAANLLRNPSFEVRAQGTPKCWTQAFGSGSAWHPTAKARTGHLAERITTRRAHSSMLLTAPRSGCGPRPVTGARYDASIWYRGSSRLSLAVLSRHGRVGRWVTLAQRTLPASRRWSEVAVTSGPVTAAADVVALGVRARGAGTLIVDDASLSRHGTGPTGTQPPTTGSPTTTTQTTSPPPPTYFATLPAGSALPRPDSWCAAAVAPSTWEPRPQNTVANHTVPNGPVAWSHAMDYWTGWIALRDKVTGNYTGTTDQIIRWAACKWGIDEDTIRAQAVQESWWDIHTVGDNGASFGLMQIKDHYPDGSKAWGGYPWTQQSTALNVDFYGAYMRACLNGVFYDGGNWLYGGTKVTNDLWGCVGSWFSGNWYDAGARSYIAQVKQHLAHRTWAQPNF